AALPLGSHAVPPARSCSSRRRSGTLIAETLPRRAARTLGPADRAERTASLARGMVSPASRPSARPTLSGSQPTEDPVAWHARSANEVLEWLDASAEGLSSRDASQRL